MIIRLRREKSINSKAKAIKKNVEVLATFNTDLIASGRPRDDAAAAFCVSPRGPDFAEIAVFFFRVFIYFLVVLFVWCYWVSVGGPPLGR